MAASDTMSVGWLLTGADLTDPAKVAALRTVVGAAGEVEVQTIDTAQTGIRSIAALLGVAVGLVILVATLSLIHSENLKDVRVLNVLGATRPVVRAVGTYTAGTLALIGALLAVPLGYVALLLARTNSDGFPFAVPWSTLLIVGISS